MTGSRRRALLTAALAFLQLRDQPPEVAPLRRWLDTWAGIGHITVGMLRQGYDMSLTSYEQGWRCSFLHRQHVYRPWVGQVLNFHPTPWRAVQHAAWKVLDRLPDR